MDNFLSFSSNLKLSSANSFSLEESKICRLVMVKTFNYFSYSQIEDSVRNELFRDSFGGSFDLPSLNIQR